MKLLLHLLTSAYGTKRTSIKRSILVRQSRAIKAEANNGAFYVSVRDTGPGISAADQAKLFQEFQLADNAFGYSQPQPGCRTG